MASERLVLHAESVPKAQKVHLARALRVLRALRVRLVVLERLVLLVQVLPGRSVGSARLVLWELPVLGESAVQLAGSASTGQVVHLARAQPVLRVQRVCLVLLVPRRTGWGR